MEQQEPEPELEEAEAEQLTPEQVDEGHKAMLAGFSKVFETHKVAYGWPDKELRFV